jgi:hypothetical protein
LQPATDACRREAITGLPYLDEPTRLGRRSHLTRGRYFFLVSFFFTVVIGYETTSPSHMETRPTGGKEYRRNELFWKKIIRRFYLHRNPSDDSRVGVQDESLPLKNRHCVAGQWFSLVELYETSNKKTVVMDTMRNSFLFFLSLLSCTPCALLRRPDYFCDEATN